MTKIKRLRTACILAITIMIGTFVASPMTVSAVNPTFGHRMTGGISDVYIYIDDKN